MANRNDLDDATAALRSVREQLEAVGGESASLMRRHVERALEHAPTPQRQEDEGDFEPGTTVGDDNARRVRELDGTSPAAAPTPEEILSENARLQERIAELEAQRNGNG